MEERINLDELDTARGAEAGFDLKLNPPDGRDMRGTLRIRGADSATYQRVLDDQQRRRLARLQMSKVPTPEEMKAETLELLAALVIGWSFKVNLEGKPLDYSPENARILLGRFSWIREQVDRAAAVRSNFLPGSSAS